MKFIIISLILYSKVVFNQDLTRQIPIEKTLYLKGETGLNHFYEPNELLFHTGKLYKLKIKNVSDSKHYFGSPSFSKSIFTRKIQLIRNTKKVVEIKGIIYEVEVWPDEELEWWFTEIIRKIKTKMLWELILDTLSLKIVRH